MKQITSIVALLKKCPEVHLPVILCFFTGTRPEYTSAMARDPAPPTGQPFDDTFVEELVSAVRLNAAIHDGAVMIGRASSTDSYSILGWSHRLYPPNETVEVKNRGSAYNSCLSMSQVSCVDGVVLVSQNGNVLFCKGGAKDI